VTRAPCAHLAQDRSALVGDALDVDRRERLLAHLVHCTECRAEVAELRRLREALRTEAPAEAPRELAQRLISIAGAEAQAPLWSRPFRRTRPGALSSRRRTLRARATTAVAVGATVVGVGVVGYVAAPAEGGAALRDPTSEAQAAFSSTIAQFPLANDALGAVMAAGAADLARPVPAAGSVQAATGTRRLTGPQARAALARAVSSSDSVGYSGVQSFWARSGGQVVRAAVQVRAVPGQGIQAQVLDRSGQPVGSGFTPATIAARMVDHKLMKLLEENYALIGWGDARAAGRGATVVEAWRSGHLAARWWVDDASGIVLGRQAFDDHDHQVMSVAFTDVRVSRSTAILEHLPARLDVPTTDTVLTLSNAPELARTGWFCRSDLAGLSLVRLRTDSALAPQAVHLVYSDGLATVSVFEQRGQLSATPRGSTWDTGLRAYTQEGASSVASWQSGGTVFTVVTDGSTGLLAQAVGSLPHEPRPERTTMERIREGWAKLLADMKG
jgi:negative regulator of sigma E activity